MVFFFSDRQVQWENLSQLMSLAEWLLLKQKRRLLCILDVLFHQQEVGPHVKFSDQLIERNNEFREI